MSDLMVVRAVSRGVGQPTKTTMLNAESLRWSDTGAALFTVNKILDTLKIGDHGFR